MADARRIVIIFVIAVLFSIFVQATIDAVYERPRYDDICDIESPRAKSLEDRSSCEVLVVPDDIFNDCREKKGSISYTYDSNGCAKEYECNLCMVAYQDEEKKYNLVVFIISAIAGLVAIVLGIYLPGDKDTLNAWVGTGFMLGGMISLFIGTARYYQDMARLIRPFVLLIELVIVILVSYKKLNSNPKRKK